MLFEIHLSDNDLSSGAVPLTWCLDKELLEVLKSKPSARVVVSVVPVDIDNECIVSKENRYVFPLRHMMGYVSFKRPGRNRIFAYVEDLPVDALEKRHGDYSSSVVTIFGEYSKYVQGYTEKVINDIDEVCEAVVPGKPHSVPLDVEVPDEAFGEEPAQWEKNWVLWLIKNKGVDQCAFRRRRLFAYTLQPLLVLLKLVFVLVLTLIALLIGARGVSLTYLFHPIIYDIDAAAQGLFSEGSIFIRPTPEKWKNEDTETFGEGVSFLWAKLWSLPLMPAFWGFLVLLSVLHNGWKVFGIILLVIISLLLLLALVLNFTGLMAWIGNKLSAIGGDNDYEDLVCDGNPNRKPKHKSVRLRYQALKAKVCKPFAS